MMMLSGAFFGAGIGCIYKNPTKGVRVGATLGAIPGVALYRIGLSTHVLFRGLTIGYAGNWNIDLHFPLFNCWYFFIPAGRLPRELVAWSGGRRAGFWFHWRAVITCNSIAVHLNFRLANSSISPWESLR
jgi:hypothetical protein